MQTDFVRHSKLVEKLKDAFPNTLPTDLSVTLDQIRVLQGHQQVIDFIISLAEDDEDNLT